MGRVGVTTTVPVEVIYAAGETPVDLNNIFVTAENPQALVEEAETAGFPRNLCAWIKGIYGTVLSCGDIPRVVGVTQGDCSNTHALMEALELAGIEVLPFAYPYGRDGELLKGQLERFMESFGVSWSQTEQTKARLDRIREKVWELDRLTWQENRISGWENHIYQINCSDFEGDPERFAGQVEELLAVAQERQPEDQPLRLGFMGVPPIVGDIYQYLEDQGARVVFNETQRQFTMPQAPAGLLEQYRSYTYPYGIYHRLNDINVEIKRRRLDGMIHYVQSFCYRQIEDLIVRKKLDIPLLTLEGDKPGQLDARSRLRLDVFLDMLR